MKILFIHNNYYRFSGEEQAAGALATLLESHGHKVEWYRRESKELDRMSLGKLRAAFASLHNPVAVDQVRQLVTTFRPDVVQVQNLYPLIAPSVLAAVKRMNVPIVMRCPNYRLFCPNGLFLDPGGQVCERCTGTGKEIHCIVNNCESDLFKSTAYALRNAAARIRDVFRKHVDQFIVQSEFQKNKFVSLGISENRLTILPGILPEAILSENQVVADEMAFVGRVSHEKGIYEFVESARSLPDIPFAVAGGRAQDIGVYDNPINLTWKGFLNEEELNQQYFKSRCIVIPSKWYEGFPNVILRAMMLERPVIASRIGGLQDIVIDGVTGLLVTPGSIKELAQAISTLYHDPARCAQMGKAARSIAYEKYGQETIYRTLLTIYHKAMQRNGSDLAT